MAQFAKGQSGNPKGRPKGSRNLRTLYLENVARPVAPGASQTRLESVIDGQVGHALNGDQKTIQNVLDHVGKFEDKTARDDEKIYPFTEADREAIADIHRRLLPQESATGEQPGEESQHGR